MSLQADQLMTFAVVAQLGSVSAAAVRLHRSQPAISSQLKGLSEAVGETLYERHRHGVRLTPTGEALLPYAQALSRALAGAQRVTDDFKGFKRGKLSIAASMTNAVYLLPGVLARFRERHPDLELELLTRNTHEAIRSLRSGEVEVALVEGPLAGVPEETRRRVLLDDDLVVIVRPDHSLAKSRQIAPEDLRGLEVVQREPGSGTREVVEQAFGKQGVSPKVVLEATGIEAVKEAVLEGLGAGFISRLAVRREVGAGLLIAFSLGQAFSRPLTLLHPRLELCSLTTQAFLATLDEVDLLSKHLPRS